MPAEEKNMQAVRDSIKDVLERVETHNDVKTIFGEAIHEKDASIIPVAAITMHGGGGGGEAESGLDEKKSRLGQGSGIGLGYSRNVRPLGYIEVREGKAVFKPILDMGKLVIAIAGISLAGAYLLARALSLKEKS